MENDNKQTYSHKVFTIRDAKANCFDSRLLVQKTTAEGLRTFQSLCVDSNTMVGKYPADFSFFELGEFDELTGAFKLHISPINLGLAAQFANPNGNVSPLKEAK